MVVVPTRQAILSILQNTCFSLRSVRLNCSSWVDPISVNPDKVFDKMTEKQRPKWNLSGLKMPKLQRQARTAGLLRSRRHRAIKIVI
jgi:hypothetical protein